MTHPVRGLITSLSVCVPTTRSHRGRAIWTSGGVAHSQIRAIAGVGETFDFRDPHGIQLELWHHDPNGVWASTVQKLEQPGA